MHAQSLSAITNPVGFPPPLDLELPFPQLQQTVNQTKSTNQYINTLESSRISTQNSSWLPLIHFTRHTYHSAVPLIHFTAANPTRFGFNHFLKSCTVIFGDGAAVGSLREVHVVPVTPAGTSTERLEILDDENHVISFSVVGSDHRLENYRSVTTLHSTADGTGTIVVESYVVDVPTGNTRDDTCVFVDTIVRCNLLRSLRKMEARDQAAVEIQLYLLSPEAIVHALSVFADDTGSLKTSI